MSLATVREDTKPTTSFIMTMRRGLRYGLTRPPLKQGVYAIAYAVAAIKLAKGEIQQ